MISGETNSGFDDMLEDMRCMLSCPVCFAENFLKNTPKGKTGSYQVGARLACIQVKNDWSHECLSKNG